MAEDTTPLTFLPFAVGEEVYCVQGNDGDYSHQGTQHYAYDFDMRDSRNSRDNPIYNVSVYTPFSGTIVEIRKGVEDFTNNSSANAENNYGWGNTIVIESHAGEYYLRIAHLQNDSIPSIYEVGDWIEQGQLIGRVGQTGYSSHPHLHMQLQETTRGESIPFDFVEGPVTSGRWVVSQMEQGLYVIDNDRRTNLGAPIGVPNHWWRLSSLYSYRSVVGSGSTGDEYLVSTNTNAQFFWGFNIHQEGHYEVTASCRGLRSRDPNAMYRLYRNGIDEHVRIDQRELVENNRAYIATELLRAGSRYYVSVQRSSGTLCADAVFIRQLGY